jgi:hypothetical protein
MTRPARKFPRTQHTQNKQTGDKYNKQINTHRLQNNEEQRKEKIFTTRKTVFTVITEYFKKFRSLIKPDENKN